MLRLLMFLCVAGLVTMANAAEDATLSDVVSSIQSANELYQNKEFRQSVEAQRQQARGVVPSSQRLDWDRLAGGGSAAQLKGTSRRLQDSIRQMEQEQSRRMEKGSLLVIVSLSLPDDLLRSYFAEAEKAGAKLVFRGFKDNDFRAMQVEMAARNLHGPYQIDPVTIRRYGIQSVPAFLLLLEQEVNCRQKECPLARHIKAEGVTSLRGFLEQTTGRDPSKDQEVNEWLERL